MRRRERPRQRPESHTGRRRPGAGHRSALRRLPAAWRRSPWPSAAGDARGARGPDPTPQADSSERPLRRREARIARPARVRIRRRKPWVLARRRLFGWKVRLLTRCLRCCQADGGRLPACGFPPGFEARGERARFGRHRKPATCTSATHPTRHGQAKAAESRPSPRYGSVEQRVKLASPARPWDRPNGSTSLNARQNPPVSGPPWLASGATRRCVDEFPPQHPVPRLRMPWRCC